MVRVAFNILKEVLGIDDVLLIDESDPELYDHFLEEAGDEFLGFAVGFKNQSRNIINNDLFKPENEHLRKIVREEIDLKSLSKRLVVGRRSIFINVNLINKGCEAGYKTKHFSNINFWAEFPLSLRSAISLVIVHELTHIQMDIDEVQSCFNCIKCKHCSEFDKHMADNWETVIRNDALRKIDFALYGIE
ncbi:UNVERIFIED_CONTAM: hypothetical protein Cloal_1152 [Acetivibrio alkalicellulosi]